MYEVLAGHSRREYCSVGHCSSRCLVTCTSSDMQLIERTHSTAVILAAMCAHRRNGSGVAWSTNKAQNSTSALPRRLLTAAWLLLLLRAHLLPLQTCLSLCWCLWWCTCCHQSARLPCRQRSGEQQRHRNNSSNLQAGFSKRLVTTMKVLGGKLGTYM